MKDVRVVIATRGSKLSLVQADVVADALQKHSNAKIELKVVKTRGDIFGNIPLQELEGKGFFAKEVDQVVMREEADIAVHSLKDVPSDVPKRIALAAVLPRASPLDALVSRSREKFEDLPKAAVIGTSSSRRKAALLRLRPDLSIEPIRGNLDTRLKKLTNGLYDAIVVAEAGLKRMGLEERATSVFTIDEMTPSPCQGIIGVHVKVDNRKIIELVERINDEKTLLEALMEREVLKIVGGGCRVPMGVFARALDNMLDIVCALYSPDGSRHVYVKEGGPIERALETARRAAKYIQREGEPILSSIRVTG
ncbi:MAG: hydroxymethylbilane synthase [Nitrososphaeria archaeon]|nr:hydroxymethylbilane synthase [Nitrososphaeria archaeon]NIQ33240.1 hydroxymethylbilane synthase [Nitrososphaeria archaeon]